MLITDGMDAVNSRPLVLIVNFGIAAIGIWRASLEWMQKACV
jgi:hypothetical protein